VNYRFVKHKEVQQIVFRKQIQIALDMNKPLVIHCREAEEDALTILDEVGFYVMLINSNVDSDIISSSSGQRLCEPHEWCNC
jgi:TatD DNase family protein